MEMETSQLCRVCLNEGLYSIHDYLLATKEQQFTAISMIQEISPREFPQNEEMPSMICATCSQELIQSFIFLDKLRTTERQIEELFAQLKSSEGTPEFEEDRESNNELAVDEDEYEDMATKTPNNDHTYFGVQSEYDFHNHLANEQVSTKEIDTRSCDLLIEKKVDEDKTKTENNFKCEQVQNLAMFPKPMSSAPMVRKRNDFHEDVTQGNSFVISAFVPIAAGSAKPSVKDKHFDNDADSRADQQESEIRTLNFSQFEINSSKNIQMEQDIRSADDDMFYMCKYCPKAFASPHYLRAHLSRTHICQHCPEVFNQAQKLSEHMRSTHTKFSCVICKKDFKCNSYLRNHIRNYHNVTLPKNVFLVSVNKKE